MSETALGKKVVFLSYAVEADAVHADQFCKQMLAHGASIEVWRDN